MLILLKQVWGKKSQWQKVEKNVFRAEKTLARKYSGSNKNNHLQRYKRRNKNGFLKNYKMGNNELNNDIKLLML